jgi:hypothetical protein
MAMEGHVKLDGNGFDVRLRVDWQALAEFLKSADGFVKAVKATIFATLVWLVLRWWFGF